MPNIRAVKEWLVSADDEDDQLQNFFRRITPVLGFLAAVSVAVGFVLSLGSADEPTSAAGPTKDVPAVEVVYWLGPLADELIFAPDPYVLMPKEFEGVRIVESPGDWLTPSQIPLEWTEVECISSACQELSSSDLMERRRTLWLVLFNAGSETMQSVALQWLQFPTRPVEADEPFAALRTSGAGSANEELLIDLPPGDGILLPLGTALRIPSLGSIRSLPIGNVRIPEYLSYELAGEDGRRRQPVREPSETVVSGGYDTTGAERFAIGG